jgi:hypothetical protein
VAGRLGRPGQQQRWDDAISFTIDYLYSLREAAVKPMPSSLTHGVAFAHHRGMMRCTIPAALVCALLSAAPASAERLTRTVVPEHYDLSFTIDLMGERFSGEETIRVQVGEATSRIVLHALELEIQDVTVRTSASTQQAAVSIDRAQETATLTVPQRLTSGSADIHLRFAGALNSRLRGLYLSRTARRRSSRSRNSSRPTRAGLFRASTSRPSRRRSPSR